MNERLKVLDFKYNVVLGTFVFFLILSLLSPVSGLDWNNYVIGSKGIIYSIKNLDFTFGGLLSGIITSVLSYNKGIFNLISAIVFSLFVKNINDLFGKIDNKFYYLLVPILMLLVSVDTFAYNYTSISGTAAYTFPSIAIFVYFIHIYRKDVAVDTFNFKDIILFIVLSTYIILSSDFLGFGFILGSILLYIYKMVSLKSFIKGYVLIILFQLILCIVNQIIIDKSLLYSSIPLIVNRIPLYIDTVYSKNIVLFILGAIPINHYLSDLFKNFIYKRVIIVIFDLLLIFSLSYNFVYYSPVNVSLVINKYKGMFALENSYFLIYYFIYLILYILTIIKYIGKKTARNYLVLFVVMGAFVSLLTMTSPSYEEGNNILFILSMIASIAILLKNISLKINFKPIKILLCLLIVYNMGIMGMVKYIDVTRTKLINEQLQKYTSVIEVKSCPFYQVYRYNPVTIFQEKDFRKYYGIGNDRTIEVKYFGIFNKIRERVK